MVGSRRPAHQPRNSPDRAEGYLDYPQPVERKGGVIALPSFHVCGESDYLVENHRSQTMSEWFVDSVIKTHSGGHFSGSISFWPAEDMKDWICSLSLSVVEGEGEVPLTIHSKIN
jgi:hypothetical protein